MLIARLTDGTDVTRQAITKHLRVMDGAGLVRASKQGRESVWEVEKGDWRRRRFLDAISTQWDDPAELRELVEE